MLAALAIGWGVKVHGSFKHEPGTAYVSGIGIPNQNVMWFICDNGGEYIVAPVNSDASDPRGCWCLAYEDRLGPVDDGTILHRVAMVLRGDPIDWNERHPDLVDVVLDRKPE
jgi:hypothetical protein